MDVRNAIICSLQQGSKSFWELVEEVQAELKVVIDALNEMYESNEIEVENGRIKLAKSSIKDASQYRVYTCNCCDGKGIAIDGEFKKLLERFKEIVKGHPRIKTEFYQGIVRPEDTIYRVALMKRLGDVVDKEIVLIGDDDLLSIALALTNLPKRIVVFDIDRELGEYIEKVCKDNGLEVEFVEYDVAKPLSKEFVGRFDVFSTEPLETVSGFKAFINRGLACLRERGSGYIGLTYLETSLKKWKVLLSSILSYNCAITDVIRDFSWYIDSMREEERESYREFTKLLKFPVPKPEGKELYWYRSALIRIEKLGDGKLEIKPEEEVVIEGVDEESYVHPECVRMLSERERSS
jgi:predicted methyltransferase